METQRGCSWKNSRFLPGRCVHDWPRWGPTGWENTLPKLHHGMRFPWKSCQRNGRTKFFQICFNSLEVLGLNWCSHASQNPKSRTSQKILKPRKRFNMLQLDTGHCSLQYPMENVYASGIGKLTFSEPKWIQNMHFLSNCVCINTT